MPPKHDFPFSPSLPEMAGADLLRLREEIDWALAVARRTCRRDSGLGPQVRPLLRRLEEIRKELDRPPDPSLCPWTSGDLYPFLIQRALGHEPYTP